MKIIGILAIVVGGYIVYQVESGKVPANTSSASSLSNCFSWGQGSCNTSQGLMVGMGLLGAGLLMVGKS